MPDADVDFAAYNSGNVMILEYPKPYFWMLVVLLFLSFVGIPLALYTTSIYETEGKKDGIDWHNRGVSYSTFTILGILSLLILLFLGYSIYNRAKRNIVDTDKKLQEQAAKIYAHAYGEKAKEIAISSGGNKLQGFKDQMYTHLMSVFGDDNMETVRTALGKTSDTEAAGRGVASTFGAESLTNGINTSAGGTEGRVAAAEAAEAEAKAKADAAEAKVAAAEAKARQNAAAPAAAPAATAVTAADFTSETLGTSGISALKASPISLSRSYRRRKSPSSLKKKKASPTKKKKASPTKKKSTSSRRK